MRYVSNIIESEAEDDASVIPYIINAPYPGNC